MGGSHIACSERCGCYHGLRRQLSRIPALELALARIFIGDVRSGDLGYAIGALALVETPDNPVALWMLLILGGVFFLMRP